MKWILVFVLILTGCFEKVTRNENDFVHVFTFNKMSKTQIFDKSLAWMAETFVSANAVIQLKDKDNGKIIGKAIGTSEDPMGAGIVRSYNLTVKIDVKNEKARIIFDNITPRDTIGNSPLSGKPMNISGMDISYKEYYEAGKNLTIITG